MEKHSLHRQRGRAMAIGRRGMLGGSLAMLATGASAKAVRSDPPVQPLAQPLAPQLGYSAPPEQYPAREGVAELPNGARLWYWDTGGSGEPIILMHAYTGSALAWQYQQPALAEAGYRVIAYSRRGHNGSSLYDPNDPGTGIGDLLAFADHLELGRFHLVGTAGGSFFALDFACSHSDRLLSLCITSAYGGIRDEDYAAKIDFLLPPNFYDLPADFREVGPSYRAENPEGTAQWLALEHLAKAPETRMQPFENTVTWSLLAKVTAPAMWLTGDADLGMPPSMMRVVNANWPQCKTVVLSEAGHATYWEQPLAYNRAVLGFIGQHPATAS